MENQLPVNNKKAEPNPNTVNLNDSETQEPPKQQFQAPPKEKKKGAGKKVLAVLLLVLLIVGAGYAGYYYADQQAQKEQDAKVAELQAQIDAAKAETMKNAASAESSEGSFLTIKEWGVKVKPTESAMLYKIKTFEDYDATYLTNALVQSLDGCKATSQLPENGYLAVLSRYKTKPTEVVAAEYVTQIDGYYYYVTGANGTCSKSESDQKTEVEQRAALVDAAKTVTEATE